MLKIEFIKLELSREQCKSPLPSDLHYHFLSCPKRQIHGGLRDFGKRENKPFKVFLVHGENQPTDELRVKIIE